VFKTVSNSQFSGLKRLKTAPPFYKRCVFFSLFSDGTDGLTDQSPPSRSSKGRVWSVSFGGVTEQAQKLAELAQKGRFSGLKTEEKRAYRLGMRESWSVNVPCVFRYTHKNSPL
jgi:hypothetical protein